VNLICPTAQVMFSENQQIGDLDGHVDSESDLSALPQEKEPPSVPRGSRSPKL
jgi:hypothetical protein